MLLLPSHKEIDYLTRFHSTQEHTAFCRLRATQQQGQGEVQCASRSLVARSASFAPQPSLRDPPHSHHRARLLASFCGAARSRSLSHHTPHVSAAPPPRSVSRPSSSNIARTSRRNVTSEQHNTHQASTRAQTRPPSPSPNPSTRPPMLCMITSAVWATRHRGPH